VITEREDSEDDFGAGIGLADLYSDEEVFAGSGRTTKFTLAEVQLAARRIEQADVVPDVQAWRAEDEQGKAPGGRPRKTPLDDWHILVACMLLVKEHTPLWGKELRNLFWFRLTPEARTFLGIDGAVDLSKLDYLQGLDWKNQVSRTLQRLLKVMDGYVAPRQVMNREERLAVLSLRDENDQRRKKERLDQFSNKMLEMTFMMLPRAIRREWKGSVSVDQTMVTAPSRKGVARKLNGEEVHDSLVMEIDAGWHSRNPDIRGTDAAANPKSSIWAREANIVIQVAENPHERAKHPLLAMAFTLSKPNEDVAGETVKCLESLRNRGHRPGRITADKGYFANLVPEELMFPVRALGYKPVFDYYKNRLGIQGGQRGAKLVEGAYLCPATPKRLIDANVNYVAKEKDHAALAAERGSWRGLGMTQEDKDARDKLLATREKYRLKQKMAPNADGDVKMSCPAEGISPTVNCPLKPQHAGASKNKKMVDAREDILVTPKVKYDVCAKHVVTIALADESRWVQELPYKGPEWTATYGTDRNVIEGYNAYIKDTGRENLEQSGSRRMRGLTAQQFIVTFLLVSANMRKIFAFIRDMGRPEHQKTPRKRRRRNHLSLGNYKTRLVQQVADHQENMRIDQLRT
jgi:hypothetical protein